MTLQGAQDRPGPVLHEYYMDCFSAHVEFLSVASRTHQTGGEASVSVMELYIIGYGNKECYLKRESLPCCVFHRKKVLM